MKSKIINLIITLVIGFCLYYITIPAINLHSGGFYAFLVSLLAIFGLLELGSNVVEVISKRKFKIHFNVIILIPIILVITVISNIVCSPLFQSKAYANRIVVDETGNFLEDVSLVDFSKTPLLDKDSSQKLGDRVMGEMRDFVSQYYVSDLYSQINYNDEIIRVTPLEYADVIKYITNHKDGVKGYIKVNSVNGEAKVVKLDKGMKYIPSAILNTDMLRHLRFVYPTKIFGEYTFEIDNEGNPYFIIPTIKYTSVGLRKEIKSIIILDPISGDSTEYKLKDVPTWVDHVYSADLIIEQVNDWGTYKEGFFNSLFAQKNVVNTTEGYNYLAMNDDIYLYTGITSVQSDESNLGFILTNMRTKETVFYSVPGAEEYSAMSSAEGQVQEKKYTASFPLLINLNNRPTYLLSLKDAAGLVKSYAFVDVVDYQKVSVSDASKGIENASKVYLQEFKLEVDSNSYKEKEITISSIKNYIIDGNTVFYIVDDAKNKYMVNINVDKELLPFVSVGDKLNISYIESDVSIIKGIK